jgi:hypothetical protein
MGKRFANTIGNANTPTDLLASGVWSLDQVSSSIRNNQWPSIVDGLILFFDAANPNSYPGSGTVVNDVSINRNSGTLLNGVGYSSLNSGYFTFDGVNDSIVMNNTMSSLTDFSIETWFFLTTTDANYRELFTSGLLGIRFGNTGFGDRLQVGVDLSTVNGCFNTSLNKAGAVNTWRHLCWTRQSGVNRVFLGGVQQNLAQGTGFTYNLTSFTNGTGVTLVSTSAAWGSGGGRFLGRLPVLRIYNRALSQSEISSNFNQLRGRYGV